MRRAPDRINGDVMRQNSAGSDGLTMGFDDTSCIGFVAIATQLVTADPGFVTADLITNQKTQLFCTIGAGLGLQRQQAYPCVPSLDEFHCAVLNSGSYGIAKDPRGVLDH